MDERLKSEVQLACKLIRALDGLSIEQARNALLRAQSLLLETQIVSAQSALLNSIDENEVALRY
jgi:hypothetical protein